MMCCDCILGGGGGLHVNSAVFAFSLFLDKICIIKKVYKYVLLAVLFGINIFSKSISRSKNFLIKASISQMLLFSQSKGDST